LPLRYQRLSLLVLLALGVLAAVFWQERAWLLDVAYQTVLMLKDGTVQVQVHRFGAAVVQVLPLLGMKLGLPLATISLLYSLSFPLVFLLFWWLAVRGFRQPTMGLALALLYTGMAYDGFYWCTSELQQGLGFLLVFWAFVLRYPLLDKVWHWLFILPALLALVFYHPLVFIPFLFIWIYLGEGRWSGRYLALGLLLVALVWAKGHFLPNWYDTSKMTTFRSNLEQFFPNYFTFPAYAKFVKHALLYWWGFPLLLMINTAWFAYTRRWGPLLLMWGFCLGFLVVNAIGSPDPAYRFYSEVNYWPLMVIVAVPFVLEVMPVYCARRWAWMGIALFFVARLAIISWHHQPYTARVAWLQDRLAEAPAGDRFVMSENQAPMDTLLMSWGTPFETLLMSAATDPDAACTLLLTHEPERYAPDLQRGDVLLNTFRLIPLAGWAHPYWQLPPEGRYQFWPE
jgi:hypothetical protein